VRHLFDRSADPNRIDAEVNSTPIGWCRYRLGELRAVSRAFVRLGVFRLGGLGCLIRLAARSCGNSFLDPSSGSTLCCGRMFVRDGEIDVAVPGERLATEVRARRAQLKLRQEELADLAGVSERFVYALENGKQTVQLDKVLAVLNALGLHLEIHRGAGGEIR
jgi:HTH-type transcriptional regulator / antitoxin HipB